MREAIRVHGARIVRLLVLDGKHPQLEALSRFAKDQGVTQIELGDNALLDRTARGARHQGVIAFAPELEFVRIEDVDPRLVLALDELEDPQNFGAIVRSAVAMGASCIVWPEHHSAPLSPATFRASAGAVEHAVLCRVPKLPDALRILAEKGARILGLDANGERTLRAAEPVGPVVLVIGSEGKGLRKPVKNACDELVRLPMAGKLDSLNASVAAALALYEALQHAPPG